MKRNLEIVFEFCLYTVLIIFTVVTLCKLFFPEKTSNNAPEIKVNGDAGYSEDTVSGVKLQAVTGVVIKDKQLQNFEIFNSKENSNFLQVIIVLGDGTDVYQSEFVDPGNMIQKISIDYPLKKGTYENAVFVYRIYDSEQNIVGQCEFPIEIKVM